MSFVVTLSTWFLNTLLVSKFSGQGHLLSAMGMVDVIITPQLIHIGWRPFLKMSNFQGQSLKHSKDQLIHGPKSAGAWFA